MGKWWYSAIILAQHIISVLNQYHDRLQIQNNYFKKNTFKKCVLDADVLFIALVKSPLDFARIG
jgi:hypothetical protein